MYQFLCFLQGQEAEEATHLTIAELIYELSILDPVADPVTFEEMRRDCGTASLFYTLYYMGCSWIISYWAGLPTIAIYYKIDDAPASFGRELEDYQVLAEL